MKKSLLRMASLAAVPVLAAACFAGSSSTTPPATQNQQSQAASQAASQTPTAAPKLTGSLTIWEAYGASGNSEITAFKSMVDAVKADNPGLTINILDVPFNDLFNKFETAAATGGGPDMYIAPNDSLPKEARASLLADVSDLSATLKADPYNESDTAISAGTVDGKLYEIPESMKAVALFYRTDMLPQAPVTTDDWMTTLKGGKTLGWVYGANGGGAYYTWGLYGAFGGTILDQSGKCAANTGVPDALKWLADAKAAGMKMYQNDNDAKADFISGKIAGFIDGPWQTGDLKKALADKLAVAPGPKGPKGDFAPLAAPDGFYINASSKNIDLAKSFALAFLTKEQTFVDQAGHIPANTKITIADPITKGFQTAVSTGYPRPTAKELDNYWGNFGNAIVAVIDKGTASTDAVATACTAMDKANKK